MCESDTVAVTEGTSSTEGASDSGRESTTSSASPPHTPPVTEGTEELVTQTTDQQYRLKIHAPGIDHFELIVNGGELVQELHQVLLDRENTCHRTCFTLQLDGEPLDHFTEWKCIEGMKSSDTNVLRVIEEPYTLRECRIHLRHVRDLMRSVANDDAFNGNDGASLSYANTIASNAVYAGGKMDTKRGRQTMIKSNNDAERASMDCTPPEHALPGYKEQSLARLHPVNKHLHEAATAQCTKLLTPSGWNPPPRNRKLKGDVMYLVVTTMEGRRQNITCSTAGFFVNQSTTDVFNPAPPSHKTPVYHSLIDLLNHMSPMFKRNFALIQKRRCQRQIFERLPTPYQVYTWSVPGELLHTMDCIRSEDGTQSHRLGLEDHIPGQTRDWNEELQTTHELPRKTLPERLIRERAIFKIHADFVAASVKGAMAVVDGNVMAINPADEPRTHMFIWNNIFFSLGFDVKDHYAALGGDAAAFVAPSNDLEGVRAYASLDNDKLYTLGMVIIDYRGYRVTAQSIIPGILEREQEQSVVYGSVDFGKTVVSSEKYAELLEKPARQLKIMPHKVKSGKEDGEEVTLLSSFETKGIIGNDGRHYVLDLLRTFPPDVHYTPDAQLSDVSIANGYPRRLPHTLACLRRELIDAFVDHRYVQFVRIAAYHLQTIKYKTEAGAIVAKEGEKEGDSGRATLEEEIATPTTEVVAKTPDSVDETALPDGATAERIVTAAKEGGGTLSTIAKEGGGAFSTTADIVAHAAKLVGSLSTTDFDIRFNPDCYCDTVEHCDKEEMTKQRDLCRDAAEFLLTNQIPTLVRDCLEHNSAPLDGSSLIESMHARGINVRYLGKVVDCLAEAPQLDYVHRIGVTELLARSVKHVLRAYLQACGASNTASATAHFLNCLLGVTCLPLPVLHHDISTPALKTREKRRHAAKKGAKTMPTRLFVDSSDWSRMTIDSLWGILTAEMSTYYGFAMSSASADEFCASYGVGKMSMLRRTCVTSGVQIVSKEYELDGRPFAEEDILSMTPLVKHISPRANDATHFYHAGQTKIQQGQLRAGYELIAESLNLLNNVYGAMHTEIAQCMRLLARLAYILGDAQGALEHQMKATQMSERCNGIDAALTIVEYIALAHYTFAALQFSTALRLLYRARYMLVLIVGEQHPLMSQVDANIGLMLYAVQEYDTALRYLQNAHTLTVKYMGKESLKAAMLSHLMARAHGCRGDYRKAMQHEKETYMIYKHSVRCPPPLPVILQLGDGHEKTRESSDCLRQLTEQAVMLQRRVQLADMSQMNIPLATHQPTLSSVLDMLNVINGVIFISVNGKPEEESPKLKEEDVQ